MKKNLVPFFFQCLQDVILLKICAKGHKGGRAVIDNDLAISRRCDQGFKKRVKLTRIYIATFHYFNFCNIELFISRKCAIHRICVKCNNNFILTMTRLIEQAGNHGFTDAALALQNEMNCCH